jgi:hypothetical protein
LKNIDEKQVEMTESLQKERDKILQTFDEKIKEIQE